MAKPQKQQQQSAWPGSEIPAQYRRIVRLLVRDQGWFYDPKGRGRHPILRDPKGVGQSSVPISPSDHRSWQNWLSQLRALGADLEVATTSSGREARRRRAAREQRAAEDRLRALDAELADQPHTPYRPTLVSDEQVAEFVARSTKESGVPLRVQDPIALQTIATLMGTARDMGREIAAKTATPSVSQEVEPRLQLVPSWQQMKEAMELLEQGYHVSRVMARTGVQPEALRHLVADDGYAR